MKRLYYIDWLRILAILVVFFFHCSHFFDPLYWHVKNKETAESVLVFLGFVNIWIMPLFFFLSGAAALSGIQKSYITFSLEKVRRLLVPFIIGTLLLIPPQKYVEALSNNTFSGGYIQFLSEYFVGAIFNYPMGFNVAWIGAISYHLWFLGHLLIISLALFPLMRYIYNHGENLLNYLHKLTSFRGGVMLLFIPVALGRILLKRDFPEYTGWSDLLMYALYFLWGYLLMQHKGLKQNIIRSGFPALLTGSLLFILYILSYEFKETELGQLFQNEQDFTSYLFRETAGSLASWAWILFFMAAGMKYLNRDDQRRQSLNEAVLPFYILHQTVLLLVGYVVVQWNWSNWGKFIFIAISSLFLITLIYQLGIKPFNAIRYLFGMKKRA